MFELGVLAMSCNNALLECVSHPVIDFKDLNKFSRRTKKNAIVTVFSDFLIIMNPSLVITEVEIREYMQEKGYLNTPLEESFYFPVEDGHKLSVEICGNPNGIPVVFFHGGPGASIGEKERTFFDPEKFRVILFDQRGTGKSRPFLSLKNNTPFATIEDVEALREHLGIEKWIVFGGSYGSTLGLIYAILHPERAVHLVLRGIFLGRQEDINWLFEGEGTSVFYPEKFERFKAHIPKEKQDKLVDEYYQLMLDEDEEVSQSACKAWADWEGSVLRLVNEEPNPEITSSDLSGALLEAHYFTNGMFYEEDNYILNRIGEVKIPIDIYQGRFDVDCGVKGAYELKQACPHANLNIVQLGSHYPYDSPLFDRLVERMDKLGERVIPIEVNW